MQKHFVTFLSPGTMTSETTTKEIESWDTDKAIKMSKEIKERHGALPYGFQFFTKERKPLELDSSESDRSGVYYLGGEVMTLEQVKERNDPNDSILISNMEGNKWDRVVVNTNSYRWTQPLSDGDVVLSM